VAGGHDGHPRCGVVVQIDDRPGRR